MMPLILVAIVIGPMAVLAAVDVSGLRCEYRVDPLGLDEGRPRLGWVIGSTARGARQTAYHVVVDGAWDSGKVMSDRSQGVEYNGKPLESGRRYQWRVRVWDQAGQASEWSQPASWTMGLLDPGDWTARWIGMRPPAVKAGSGTGLRIIRAVYAARDGSGSAEVTAVVSSLVKHGALDVEVAPRTLGGDPAANRAKDLLVTYEIDGEPGTASVADFRRLVLPAPIPAPSPYLRRTFDLEVVPDTALASVNVMGFYELHVNGRKVGPNVMGPALSNYGKRSLYETYDLVPYLRKGHNCIGLWLGRGWRDSPVARLQLDMTVAGRPLRIATDGGWLCKPSNRAVIGPWQWNNMGGELVDARQEDPRWCEAEGGDDGWARVVELPPFPIPAQAQKCPPMRVLKVIPAVSCEKRPDGRYQLDFATQLTGGLRLRLRGQEAGRAITIVYADKLEPLQTYNQLDRFVCAGKPLDEFASKFNYHGFRWAIIEGLVAAPAPGDAEAEMIGADFETRGGFACSDDQINRMHEVDLWTIRCLSQSGYLSDCPHRERLGYGDGQVSIESCMMNFMMQPFYDKWSIDWCDGADAATGYMPHTAPQGYGGGGPAWGGSAQALAWRNYLYYGDRRIIERNIDACGRHIQAIEAHAKDGIVRAFGGQWDFIGDWVPPERGMDTNNWPPRSAAELFNNCYRLYLREQWARMAEVLGRHQEAEACRAELARLRPLVHSAFYDPDRQQYVLDEQAYYLMPLMTGVVPENLRPAIMGRLEGCVRSKRGGHLDTGMLGTYFLLDYLMEVGRNDLLWLMVARRDYPGWGYMLEQGATTWWEQWNGHWSQIHSCFTSLDGWFFRGLAGIRPDLERPGFRSIVIKPAVIADLAWVTCHHDSAYGRIVSNWNRDGRRLAMEVEVPPNTTALVHVPAADVSEVTESGQRVGKAEGVGFVRMEGGAAVLAVGSGSYRFRSTLPSASE